MKLIDVSYSQREIDWEKVKTQVDGVMIRCGFRGYIGGRCTEDARLESHVEGAKKVGLKIGLYFFSEAITEEEGKEEAQFVLKLMKAYKIDPYFPIAIDTEYINDKRARANDLSVSKRTAIVKAFCEEIKSHGYTPMVYANTDWLNNKLHMSKLPYKVWVAHYASKCGYKGKYCMWQYTDKGKVKGIDGYVDMDYCYEEFKKETKMATVKWSGNLTEHFTLAEYTIGNTNTVLSITQRAYQFAECLEEFRRWLGRPMTVTSWKRTKALNSRVGGVANSNHLTGTACDWHTNITIDSKTFVKYAKKWKAICKAHGFVGEAGLYKWGCHFGIQTEAQVKLNKGKFFNWDSRSGKQQNMAFRI